MSNIDWTSFTLTIDDDNALTARDIATTAYSDIHNVDEWLIDQNGMAVLEREDGATFEFSLEARTEDDDTATIDGWTATAYDVEGDMETTDGAPIETAQDIDALFDLIIEWAGEADE